jgi:citrate lyase subunit beta/citryl-CoA lyase
MARSFLFVPGDSQRKLDKAATAGADALILDLEDSVSEENKETARRLVAVRLQTASREVSPALWVRINALDTPHAAQDLAAVATAALAGILLPKSRSPADVRDAARQLDALESARGQPPGGIGIIATVTETPEAALRVGEYREGAPRLRGLTWGAEDLGRALGATASRDEHGRWLPLFEQLRSTVLLAAAAAGIQPIDTIFANTGDVSGLRDYVAGSRRLGFTAMLAIHPAQVAIINDGYRPTVTEIEYARSVVTAFEQAGGAGVISLNGRMLDLPHLRQAQELLARTSHDPR